MERVCEAAQLKVGAGTVESDEAKAKHPGLFVEILKYRQCFIYLDRINLDQL